MTGNTKQVEPPLNSRRVQILVASILVFALLSIIFVSLGAINRIPNINDSRPVESVTIDLNHAASRELSLLPGIGPVLAKRIVENRDRLGPFASLEEIGRVHGVGDKTIQRIDRYVTVQSNWNAGKPSTRIASTAPRLKSPSAKALPEESSLNEGSPQQRLPP